MIPHLDFEKKSGSKKKIFFYKETKHCLTWRNKISGCNAEFSTSKWIATSPNTWFSKLWGDFLSFLQNCNFAEKWLQPNCNLKFYSFSDLLSQGEIVNVTTGGKITGWKSDQMWFLSFSTFVLRWKNNNCDKKLSRCSMTFMHVLFSRKHFFSKQMQFFSSFWNAFCTEIVWGHTKLFVSVLRRFKI